MQVQRRPVEFASMLIDIDEVVDVQGKNDEVVNVQDKNNEVVDVQEKNDEPN